MGPFYLRVDVGAWCLRRVHACGLNHCGTEVYVFSDCSFTAGTGVWRDVVLLTSVFPEMTLYFWFYLQYLPPLIMMLICLNRKKEIYLMDT